MGLGDDEDSQSLALGTQEGKKKTLAFKLSNETEEALKYLLTEWCFD